MFAFSPIPMFDRMGHPSVPTTFPGARGRVAVKDGRKATAKRRPASLRAPRPRATLATGGHSIPLPLPTIPIGIGKRKWEAHQKAGWRSHQLSCSCSVIASVSCLIIYRGRARRVGASIDGFARRDPRRSLQPVAEADRA